MTLESTFPTKKVIGNYEGNNAGVNSSPLSIYTYNMHLHSPSHLFNSIG